MSRSDALYQRACQVIPGGVNSPVRAFNGVGGNPPFIEKAKGAYIYDADGKAYIDYVGSWGPMITGHANDDVLVAIQAQAVKGLSFGAPTELEILLAQKVCELVPSIEQVRMVSSGTEATMSAIRLARGFTGRDKIVKFEGCYHGHADSLLVKAGSGALTMGEPTSPGVPKALAAETLTLTFNDIDSVKAAFAELGEQIACIIVEPVAGNMNCIPPAEGFLQGLRDVCDEYGSVLIFDEVMTGFRVALGGAQAHYGIKPDLTTLGKVIGAGLPVGAFGGRKDIMQHIAPTGPVYQAGTLSGNPLAMAAGLAMMEQISAPGFHENLAARSKQFCEGLLVQAKKHNIPLSCNYVGGMFGLFFSTEQVSTYQQATACDVDMFKRFFHAMLEQGVYLAPSAFEAGFIGSAHTSEIIEETLEKAGKAFATL